MEKPKTQAYITHPAPTTPPPPVVLLEMRMEVAEVVKAALRALGPVNASDQARKLGDEVFFALDSAGVSDNKYSAYPISPKLGRLAFKLSNCGDNNA